MFDTKSIVLITDPVVLYVHLENLKSLKVVHVAQFQDNDHPCGPELSYGDIAQRYKNLEEAVRDAANDYPMTFLTPMSDCATIKTISQQINAKYLELTGEPAGAFNFKPLQLMLMAYQQLVKGVTKVEVVPQKTGITKDYAGHENKYLMYYYLETDGPKPFVITSKTAEKLVTVDLSERFEFQKWFSAMNQEQKDVYINGLTADEQEVFAKRINDVDFYPKWAKETDQEEKNVLLLKITPPQVIVTLDAFENEVSAEFRVQKPRLAHLLVLNEQSKLQLISKQGKQVIDFKQVFVEGEAQLEAKEPIDLGEWSFAFEKMRAPIVVENSGLIIVKVDEKDDFIVYKYKDEQEAEWMRMKM